MLGSGLIFFSFLLELSKNSTIPQSGVTVVISWSDLYQELYKKLQ